MECFVYIKNTDSFTNLCIKITEFLSFVQYHTEFHDDELSVLLIKSQY
jgi:hypothetical protein